MKDSARVATAAPRLCPGCIGRAGSRLRECESFCVPPLVTLLEQACFEIACMRGDYEVRLCYGTSLDDSTFLPSVLVLVLHYLSTQKLS